MEELIQDKGLIKAKLTRFNSFLVKIQPKTSDELITNKVKIEIQKRLDVITTILAEYENLHVRICRLNNDITKYEEEFINFENSYFNAVAEAEGLIETKIILCNSHKSISENSKAPSLSPPSVKSNGSSANSNANNSVVMLTQQSTNMKYLKLPKISLTKFSGNIENWSVFKSTFSDMVHENNAIGNVQKLHYLKNSLVGEAADVISALEFTSDNYKIAWETVLSRFDQPKLLIKNHLHAIIEMENMTKESSAKIRKIGDKLSKHINALKSFGTVEQLFEALIINLVTPRLDNNTLREWESTFNKIGTNLPTIKDLQSFLQNHAAFLENIELKKIKVQPEKTKYYSKSLVTNGPICYVCKKDHFTSRCDVLINLNVNQRLTKVKELGLCLNCLNKGHPPTKCNSRYTCKTCNAKHHTLLHFETKPAIAMVQVGITEPSAPHAESASTTSAFCSTTSKVLLPTALARIIDSNGIYRPVRILLDSGSQSHFINSNYVRKLALPTQDVCVAVSGLNNSNSQIKSKCEIQLISNESNYMVKLSCLVINQITGTTPGFTIEQSKFKIPDNVRLSDPSYNQPGEIDLLIGSPLFFELLCIGQIRLGLNLPILQKTRLGWVIAGPTNICMATQVECFHSTIDIQDQIAKFWELESFPTDKVLSAEEHACEVHYAQNTTRNTDGRFIVSIPFKQTPESLSDSLTTAKSRFLKLEKRLLANPNLRNQYSKFMREYEELGHMTQVSPSNSPMSTYYFPHHGVQKETSTTTKLRVVFNGSAVSSNGISLNNLQMVVLGWIKTSPNLLKTFCCNRVAEIQQLTHNASWRHVSKKVNPADLLSRGVTPQVLIDSSLWWNGPPWLTKEEALWPTPKFYQSVLPELKSEVKTLAITQPEILSFTNFSNLSRLERILAYVLRFIKNCKLIKDERALGPLNSKELHSSLFALTKIAQRDSFAADIMQLKINKSLKSKSSLIGLNPFIDCDGLLRVGGRLRNSPFSYDKKHPVLLSGSHHLTKLLVLREHLRMLHAGPQLLLTSIRDRFWIISGRNLVKHIVHQCVRCFRLSPKITEPIMGDLPRERIQQSFPFSTIGIDYAGPLLIKDRKGRGAKTSKAYICLYICFATKAIHIELVSDLSTESFLLSFRRFVARRGKPSQVFSDNGTNFVGANSHLRELGNFIIKHKTSIVEAGANEGIAWHFIPARSPHFGGLWEAGIKACKFHLKRVIGLSVLTFEEYCTLLAQVESLLNSRPLSPLSTDPNDLQPLTPAHFLVGKSLIALPDTDVTHLKENRLSSFQRIQLFYQHIWKRWNKEYISELQQRQKWKTQRSDLQLGTLVLVKEDNLPPLKWKLARVIELHPGADKINRVATIRTSSGTCRRSFAKLCPLPVNI